MRQVRHASNFSFDEVREMTDKNKQMPDVIAFLLGEGKLEGYSFGEYPYNGENYKRRYWWRKYLREAWNTRATPPAKLPFISHLLEQLRDMDDQNVVICVNKHTPIGLAARAYAEHMEGE